MNSLVTFFGWNIDWRTCNTSWFNHHCIRKCFFVGDPFLVVWYLYIVYDYDDDDGDDGDDGDENDEGDNMYGGATASTIRALYASCLLG